MIAVADDFAYRNPVNGLMATFADRTHQRCPPNYRQSSIGAQSDTLRVYLQFESSAGAHAGVRRRRSRRSPQLQR